MIKSLRKLIETSEVKSLVGEKYKKHLSERKQYRNKYRSRFIDFSLL
jgi:hypothetical protein